MQQITEIKWHVKKHPNNCTEMIIIDRCPRCGKPGRLVSGKIKIYGKQYKIIHDRNNKGCSFSWSSPYWDQLDKIYRTVRGI